jgi:hypothetical protein
MPDPIPPICEIEKGKMDRGPVRAHEKSPSIVK